jgi:hypothetical protein
MNTRQCICVCIPKNDVDDDDWTELLVSSFRSKDVEARGFRVMDLEALQEYLDEERARGNRRQELEYNIGSFIGKRFSEIVINFVLAFWFKVDGFSTSLVSRRTIRDHLVNSKGSGFAANAFLMKAIVQFNADNIQVFQVLTFRGNCLSSKTLSFTTCGANLICFIGWVMLISFDCGDIAPPLCEARV